MHIRLTQRLMILDDIEQL